MPITQRRAVIVLFAPLVVGAAGMGCLFGLDGFSGGPTSDGGPPLDMGVPTGESGIKDAGASETGSAVGALGPIWLAYGTNAGVIQVRTWDGNAGAWSAPSPGPSVSGATV